jgi:inner membrane protein
VLRSRARGVGFAAMLATLYAALYGLLVSEDNALVLGSGLLFLILAAIMVVTRKVDWYALGARRPLPG